MTDPSRKLQKLQHQNTLLQSELAAIKSSRAYKLVKTAGVVKNKAKQDPAGFARKVAAILLKRPGRIFRLARGGEANSALQDTIQNRLANYHAWIAINEPNEEDLEVQREASHRLAKKPLISIVTPVFNPPVDVLEELIVSVTNQTYPYFELCLGDFGDDDDVKELLEQYARRDARIKVYQFDENHGIAFNSNKILEKVTGDYIALLDHDDTISPDALYENALLINKDNCDFIYSDKDMVDEQGNRFEPLFKPDWSPEIMLSANYPTHLNVMRTSIVKQVGGWDSITDGAQDWDLFLRVIQASKKIGHIPKVLYHWRIIATSTAHSIETKPYALEGQRVAVRKYLAQEKLAAQPFHHKTELLLKWKEAAVEQRPLVIVHGRSMAATLRLLAALRHAVPKQAKFVVVCKTGLADYDKNLLTRQNVSKIYQYPTGDLGRKLNEIIAKHEELKAVLFMDDTVNLPRKWDFSQLAGWLSIKGVGFVGGKVLDRDDNVADCGSVITPDGPVPLFKGFPAYYQGYIGNVEWVRNLRIVSRQMFIARTDVLRSFHFDESLSDEATIVSAMITASKKHRLVFCPKVIAHASRDIGEPPSAELAPHCQKLLSSLKSPSDTYSNINLRLDDPMQLRLSQAGAEDETFAPSDYQRDALALANIYDLTAEEIAYNQQLGAKPEPLAKAATVGWFLPGFNAIYAGLNNIFSYAEYLATQQKLTTYFFIMRGDQGVQAEQEMIISRYPGLKKAKFISIAGDVPNPPALDIGICTQWASAFPLAKLKNVKRKCYFIQDHESNFYPQGSTSAMVNLTYRLNFFAISNTQGLMDLYKQNHGGRGAVLKSVVDMGKWHPPAELRLQPKKPYKVFFYARPNEPRNAFELGMAGLAKLKSQLGKNVQIFTAGAAWDDEILGLNHIVTNLNKIPYDDVPAFYREIDAGMMFMFSGHPGVTASELMASGCPVVVNEYDDTTWHDLYQHEKTCLVTTPTASEIARNLRRCLEDQELRKKLIKGGLKKAESFYKGYEASREPVYKAILKG